MAIATYKKISELESLTAGNITIESAYIPAVANGVTYKTTINDIANSIASQGTNYNNVYTYIRNYQELIDNSDGFTDILDTEDNVVGQMLNLTPGKVYWILPTFATDITSNHCWNLPHSTTITGTKGVQIRFNINTSFIKGCIYVTGGSFAAYGFASVNLENVTFFTGVGNRPFIYSEMLTLGLTLRDASVSTTANGNFTSLVYQNKLKPAVYYLGSTNLTLIDSSVSVTENILVHTDGTGFSSAQADVPRFIGAITLTRSTLSGANLSSIDNMIFVSSSNYTFTASKPPLAIQSTDSVMVADNLISGSAFITGTSTDFLSFRGGQVTANTLYENDIDYINTVSSISSVTGLPQYPSSEIYGDLVLTVASASYDFADDTAAASGGIPLGGVYRTGNSLKIRLS